MVLEYRHEQPKNDFPNDEPLTRKRNLTFVPLLRHSYLAHEVPVEEPSTASIADIRPPFDHLVGAREHGRRNSQAKRLGGEQADRFRSMAPWF
jgi:hypothetical protein